MRNQPELVDFGIPAMYSGAMPALKRWLSFQHHRVSALRARLLASGLVGFRRFETENMPVHTVGHALHRRHYVIHFRSAKRTNSSHHVGCWSGLRIDLVADFPDNGNRTTKINAKELSISGHTVSPQPLVNQNLGARRVLYRLFVRDCERGGHAGNAGELACP